MAKKQYNLKQILSNEAYKDVETYLSPKLSNGEDNVFYGVDGFAMAGLKGYQSVGISKVVQMLQNLADPKFINLRETWGDNYAETNKLVENVACFCVHFLNISSVYVGFTFSVFTFTIAFFVF